MPTQHQHRLFIICPLARVAALNAWITTTLNPEGGDWLTVPLSATGTLPATHFCCDTSLTTQQLLQLVGRLHTQAGGTNPTNAVWQGWTRAQKINWVKTTAIPAIRTGIGVRLRYNDNDGNWADHRPDLERQDAGLQAIGAAVIL